MTPTAPAPHLTLAEHPLLEIGVVTAEYPAPLGELPTPAAVRALLEVEAEAPLAGGDDDSVRLPIRELLRWGGYRPAGRGKPASEYLRAAATAGRLPSINLAVDIVNVVSLHCGLPISVVDADLVRPPLSVRIAGAGDSYVFNASGQEIDLEGLVCLFDASGPCANAVRDAQRTKTGAASRRTLTVIWSHRRLSDRLAAAIAWYGKLLEEVGASVQPINPATPPQPPTSD